MGRDIDPELPTLLVAGVTAGGGYRIGPEPRLHSELQVRLQSLRHARDLNPFVAA